MRILFIRKNSIKLLFSYRILLLAVKFVKETILYEYNVNDEIKMEQKKVKEYEIIIIFQF